MTYRFECFCLLTELFYQAQDVAGEHLVVRLLGGRKVLRAALVDFRLANHLVCFALAS